MTDLEKFRELMTSFGLELEQFPSDGPRRPVPWVDHYVVLVIRPAMHDLGCDYPPVFVFNGDGSFYQVGSTV